MTSEQIIKALDRYLAHYAQDGEIPARFPSEEQMHSDPVLAVQHVLWMCHEAKKFAHASPAKAMRWLCFIQGVLWALEGFTIDEFKDDNRGPG